MDTKEKLLEILSEFIEIDIEKVDTSASFKLSTGLDSFGLLALVAAIEEQFEIAIPNEELLKFKCLDDIIAYINGEDQ